MANSVGMWMQSGAGPSEHPPVVDGYVSLNKPVPASFSDPLWVIVPSYSTEAPYRCVQWGAIHGAQLPAAGAACQVTMSPEGIPTVVWWSGEYAGFDTGDMKTTARATAPTGWLLCEGQEELATDYAALAEQLGTGATSRYGEAKVGYIRIPDARGRVLMGASTVYPLGSSGGEASVALTVAQMPAHTHAPHSGQDFIESGTGEASGEVGGGTFFAKSTHTASTGGGEAHNNLQPYLTANLLIKT